MDTQPAIKETSRRYRGATVITLRWQENNETYTQEFSDEKEAAAFKKQLISRFEAEKEQTNVNREQMDRLATMGLEVADATYIIEELMKVAPDGFEYWVESLKAYQPVAKLCESRRIEHLPDLINSHLNLLSESEASPQTLLENHSRLEALKEKLQPSGTSLEGLVDDYTNHAIEGVTFKEMSDIYHRYCAAKLQSTEILKAYRKDLEKNESDEDERYYTMSKLKKMANHFAGDIINTRLEQAREWIISEPGSGSAKERLTEIVEDFYDYMSADDSKLIQKHFVA